MFDAEKGIFVEHSVAPQGMNMPKSHAHPFHELYVQISGERRYLIGHRIYDVVPDDVVFIPKTELHRTTNLNDQGYERYVVYFYEAYLQDFISAIGSEAFSELLKSGCLRLPAEQVRRIRRLLEEMEREQGQNVPYAAAAIKTMLQEILLRILRHGGKKEHAVGEGANKIETVARYISEHYDTEITLEQAAQLACMEKTYFSKCFKRYTGFGFNEYLTQNRLRAAEKLLQYSEDSVGDISDACGFSSSNYFGDVFRRYKGVSPKEYRRQLELHE